MVLQGLFLLVFVCQVTTVNSLAMSRTILPYVKQLNNEFRIILASGSPRRRELLTLMGLSHEVMVSSFAENLDKAQFPSPQEYCRCTAVEKVKDVLMSVPSLPDKKTIVIGADTIVAIDNQVLEKPRDQADALRMISLLSGRTHEVHTAVVVCSDFHDPSERVQKIFDSFVVTSSVQFAELSEADISAYVATGEGNDKAGSYGIQGLGGQMVQGIHGCYFNVMGLPVHALSSKLAEMLERSA